MDIPILMVISALLVAIILFSIEKISPDIITLCLLIFLVGTGILSAKEAFEGFGNDFIVMLAAIFMISASMQSNGIVDWVAARIIHIQQPGTAYLITIIMLSSGGMSAFMNNTAVSAIFVAPLISLARRFNISPSKLLMPMAFAALLGGTCTLIGTSTNIAGNAYMLKAGMQPMTMFELFPLGITCLLVGTIYMASIGKQWLPNQMNNSYTEKYEIRSYLSEIIVLPKSKLIGKHVFGLRLGDINVRILKIIRNKQALFPDSNTTIETNDLLLVEANQDDLMKMRRTQNIDILGAAISDIDLQGQDVCLAEVMVLPHCELVNNTLKATDFRKKRHLSVLAIHRYDENINQKVAHEPIKTGDILLVQGKQSDLDLLRSAADLIIVNQFDESKIADIRKGWRTLAFFAAAVLLGSFDIVPMSIAFVSAAILTIVTKCYDLDRAYASVEWRLLVLIGGMTAFGKAMEKTGADVYLAQNIVEGLSWAGTLGIMGGFMLLTVLLTQPMSNAAAALVVLPIAIQTAQTLGANERAFAIAVIASASISMVTPFEPACLLVYSSGNYRISDFIKIGGLLTLLLIIIMLFMIPLIWGI